MLDSFWRNELSRIEVLCEWRMTLGKGESAGEAAGVGMGAGVDGGIVREQQDRTTVPEGPWEQRGGAAFPVQAQRDQGHVKTRSADLGGKGACYSVLRIPCGPQDQEEWGWG